jgi:hypothetical protein
MWSQIRAQQELILRSPMKMRYPSSLFSDPGLAPHRQIRTLQKAPSAGNAPILDWPKSQTLCLSYTDLLVSTQGLVSELPVTREQSPTCQEWPHFRLAD